jgi:hypothetical protein
MARIVHVLRQLWQEGTTRHLCEGQAEALLIGIVLRGRVLLPPTSQVLLLQVHALSNSLHVYMCLNSRYTLLDLIHDVPDSMICSAYGLLPVLNDGIKRSHLSCLPLH